MTIESEVPGVIRVIEESKPTKPISLLPCLNDKIVCSYEKTMLDVGFTKFRILTSNDFSFMQMRLWLQNFLKTICFIDLVSVWN